MTDKPLSGKAALITGGSRGIGAGIAKRLAADGAGVAVTYLKSPDKAEAVAKACDDVGGKGLAIQADAGDVEAGRQAVDKVVNEFGRLDFLVNNPVDVGGGTVMDVTEETFDRSMAVNLRGPFFLTQAAAKRMSDGGRIINIGSVFADIVPVPGIDIYTMSKRGIAGLTKAWARDLAERQITVNCIQPGPIETDMNQPDSELGQVLIPMTALKRYGTVEEIAGMAAYLCGPEGGNVTGAIINNDGGMTL